MVQVRREDVAARERRCSLSVLSGTLGLSTLAECFTPPDPCLVDLGRICGQTVELLEPDAILAFEHIDRAEHLARQHRVGVTLQRGLSATDRRAFVALPQTHGCECCQWSR